jgi:tetratricopeptide (TPR) repeat protein
MRFWLVVMILPGTAGCATFGRRGADAEKAATCRVLSQQGVAAMQLGQWQRAELLLEEAVAASPDDPQARRHLAEVFWHRGATAQAATHMQAAVRTSPADAGLAVRAGEMALAIGARDLALSYADQAIRSDPQLASAWTLRGRTFWQLQQPERAIADLERSLEFAPERVDVLLDLAVMHRDRGQPARCLTTLYHLYDAFPPGAQPQAALELEGLTLLDLGRPHQACIAFLAASKRGPASAQILYYLAHAQYGAGKYAEATTSAEQALAIDASHEPSRQLLAQLAALAPGTERQRR